MTPGKAGIAAVIGLIGLQAAPPEHTAALQSIRQAFQERYVFPEMRTTIVARLDQAQKSGRYDVDDPVAFAERITQDLQDVSHDNHLSLRVDPAAYAAARAPRTSDEGQDAYERRRALRNHHGLTETRILPGNIRYLKLEEFAWINDETGAVYDAAMRFLKDGDAVIIDLRGNGGGSHAAVRYLVSHFLDGDTLLLTFLEGSKPPTQSHALEHLPAGRLKGKPLYVLINDRVASAAEEFACHVEQFKLGELVGATTAGGANNNILLPIAPNFILSVSYGRPVHAVSQANWEGVGIKPTVETPPAQELDVASLLAFKRLSASAGAPPAVVAEYAWARTAVEARLRPVTIQPERLQTLAGRYGDADVALRDGVLWLTRPRRQPTRLKPLTAEGLFLIEGSDVLRVRFAHDRLELLALGAPAPRVFLREPRP